MTVSSNTKILRNIVCAMLLMLSFQTVSGQSDRQFIRNGNKLYRQQDYAKAEVEYSKAIAANASNTTAIYNLGCALQMQQKDSAAVVQYEKAGKAETSKRRKSMAYHNIGVICQKNQLFQEAIEAYKESLRNNPGDNETRYNLELCKRQLKKQNQNGGSQKNEDKNKDKDKPDKQQKQDKNKQNQQQQQQQQQNKQQQMSKENAEQLLNAAMQEEKATQKRMKQKMQQPQRRSLNNNW
ncbi:MAG: tetratricopeptide repeat protein [Prevotella sp.]